ncbi:hypothetical protein [Pedobacter xixiisoli]|uniref:Uncharacterized protein n=1 Tax=Pedobacter xixiisoli TaxID=1476464 RepID=A0A285ZWE1_9SPHI|nr:hypothetical protein [Pedobacter xixiisoli]SOD13950.1 hypothetical protein SAMN06297358_1324 [Pedobacter xixiisoli]
MNRCPFLNQLRYCYASAQISAEGQNVSIRFDQELNIENGTDALRFILMPLCELAEIDCSYIVSIYTPSMVYLPCQLKLGKGEINIAPHPSFGTIEKAS